jgi:hypothetical protein
MKRKDTVGWLFTAMVISVSIAILVCAISTTQGALINPYENWIETKDLKNCTISFIIDATYSDSSFGELERLKESKTMEFENGEFDSANNTFRVSNTTETNRKSCIDPGVDIKGILKRECRIVFDSGANNIKSFSASVKSNYISSKGNSCQKEEESEVLIRGNGSHFPFSRKNWGYTSIKLGPKLSKVFYIKDTVYWLRGPEEMSGYIKDIVKRKNTTNVGEKCSHRNEELTGFKFVNTSHLKIEFNGYLPRLRDSKGACSSFGGKNDTGIDVKLRTDFYNSSLGKFGSNFLMSYKEFYKIEKVRREFDRWMYEREDFFGSYEKAGWEGTGLLCGPARLLDTENDYYCALRFHDKVTERYGDKGKPGHQHWWREQKIKVTNTANNISVIVAPVDWGPHVDTNRVIDLSEKAIKTLGADTDTTIVEISIVDSDTPLGLVTN